MTCSVASPKHLSSLLLPLAAVALLASACASSSGGAPAGAPPVAAVEAERLINLSLSPEYSQWLLGPVAALASPEEEQAYLALTDDAAAKAFIEDFWQRRDPLPERPDNPLLTTFQQRAAVADRLYTEGGRRGSHTARGTIYVLYGKPSRTDYDIGTDPRDPPIELWFYPGEQPPGLDGEPPAPFYRFIKRGEVTEFYRPLTGIAKARPIRPEDH